MRTDAEIQHAVLRELKWDIHVDETDVGVEAESGVVTLSGHVSSWAKRIAAQKAAHRVAGVLDVANDLSVKEPGSPGHTDTEIAQAVRDALKWGAFVPDTRITSTVSSGHVTLEGTVEYLTHREDAEKAVRGLSGVRRVVNSIAVVPPRAVAPADVKSAISEALERRTGRELEQIHVDVHDGCAIVSGSVHTWAERLAVLGAAKGTAGVRAIEDHLHVKP